MDKASCLSNHLVSGDRRKGEIDEDARAVYLVWLDGNGMRDVGLGRLVSFLFHQVRWKERVVIESLFLILF